MMVDALLDRWLEVKRSSVAPRTIESYEWIATKYLRPRLGHRKLASVRAMDLDEVYAELHADTFRRQLDPPVRLRDLDRSWWAWS